MKQEKLLYNKFCNEAVNCIDAITDPIAKVRAIASILPFISKDMKAEVNNDIEEIEKEVKEKVAAEKAKLKAETVEEKEPIAEENDENIITLSPEKSVVSEEPVPTAEEEIVIKENETSEEQQKRLEAVTKKYGHLTLKDFMSQDLEYLNKEFLQMNAFKQLTEDYAKRNGIGCTDGSVYMKYYMDLADSKNPKIKEDITEMKVSTFVEVFYPFMVSLFRIYQFSPENITRVMRTMSNGTYKSGLSDINVNNAEALADALEEACK